MAKLEIIRTISGRYNWYTTLQLVEYIPKGNQKATWQGNLGSRINNLNGAMKKALNHAASMSYE